MRETVGTSKEERGIGRRDSWVSTSFLPSKQFARTSGRQTDHDDDKFVRGGSPNDFEGGSVLALWQQVWGWIVHFDPSVVRLRWTVRIQYSVRQCRRGRDACGQTRAERHRNRRWGVG